MHILVVIYEFPPVGGGGGMVAQDLCQGLVRRGHEVRILTAHYGDLPYYEQQAGVDIYRVPSARRSPYIAGFGAMAGFVTAGLWAGQTLVRQQKPDLIHVHFAVPSGPVAWALSRQYNIPYVLTAHLGDVPGGVPEKTQAWFRWVNPFTPPIWKRASAVAAVSEYTRQLALKRYPVEICTIPNGVDLHELDPGQICAGDPPLIVFAGRFMPQKNPVQVVRSLAELADYPWRCVMLGDGPLREDVQQSIRQLGLEARFELPGWVSPEEVLDWYRRSDILFMPSLSEGLPVVGVRALAMGLVIVASRVGGFIDLVEDGYNGRLVDPANPAGYKAALQEVLADRRRLQACREASRRKASEFDLEHILDAYEGLFQRAIARKETPKKIIEEHKSSRKGAQGGSGSVGAHPKPAKGRQK